MAYRALIAALIACLVAVPVLAQAKKEPKKEAAKKEQPAAASSSDDPIIAKINGQAVHRSEALMLKNMLPAQAQQQPFDQLYPRLLDQVVSMTLVTQTARKMKVADDPTVKLRIELATEQVLEDVYFGEIMKKEITQDKIRARYDKYVKDDPVREEVNARHILVPTEDEAKAIIAELNKGADFATLAKEKTTDPTGKTSGGDLGWFGKQDMVPEFSAAAFKLKKGEYTQTPVHTQFGWHVIKVEDTREGKAATYEQMAPRLAQQMAQEIAGAKVRELAAASTIEVFRPDGSPIPRQAPAAGAPAGGAPSAAAPQLTPGAGAGAAAAPGTPTLSPATAPGMLGNPGAK